MKRRGLTMWILLAGLLWTTAQAGIINGRVYLDRNGNGQPDADEPGMASVLVSDGVHVVATDTAGHYHLPAGEGPSLLAITVPRNHAVRQGFWRWSDGSHDEDFALVPQPQQDRFYFIQITDTHIGRGNLLQEFARRVNHFPLPVGFVINTGDLAGDLYLTAPEKTPKLFDQYIAAVAPFTMPLFNVPGNHDHVGFMDAGADHHHPFYGKGLYRHVLGPTHYSWDWGNIHFVALDGTSLPYQEKLGEEQRSWLAADLGFQPPDKPIVLFCHQSLPKLLDARELMDVLKGHRVLAGFCGHLHSTFNTDLAGIPVIHTGAMCGAWWSGPNLDGTPQGFRLVSVDKDRLESVYSNREGDCSLYVSTPLANAIQTGRVPFQIDVLDFGRPAQVTATLEGRPVAVEPAEKHAVWSTWKGILDTTQCDDGHAVLEVRSRADERDGLCRVRYLVVNGRPASYRAEHAAVLKLQVRGIHAPDEVLVNGQPLGIIAADTPNNTTLSFPITAENLQKLTRVTVCAAPRGKGKDNFSVGPIWMEYQGAKLYDLRFATFERHAIGDSPLPKFKPQRDWYFLLPDIATKR